MADEGRIPLVALVGPSGVGKTELAVTLAERMDGEIVSADSVALYRELEAGTAKPSREQRARVPHHLVDVADPWMPWTLEDYRAAAHAALATVAARGRLPLLVGGTGQYVTAVVEGWTPPGRDPAIRQDLEERARRGGGLELHAELQAVDAKAAQGIDPRNVRRVVRALEVYRATGQRISDRPRERTAPYRPLWIGLRTSRSELYSRLDQRLESMLPSLVQEVRNLLQRGLDPERGPMLAIGYRQVADHIRHGIPLQETRAQIRRALRRLVRHQANWFRAGDPRIVWIDAGPLAPSAAEAVIRDWRARISAAD